MGLDRIIHNSSFVNSQIVLGITKDMNDLLPTTDFTNLISAALLRLRMKSPFFGTLAMFARFIASETIPAAATDGRDIFLNPRFLHSLSNPQQDGMILHELLHAALLHPLRLRERQPQLWNIAADIVVNGTISQQTGVELPFGGLRDERLEHLSVEEVYELLQSPDANRFDLTELDLLAAQSNPAANILPQLQDSNITGQPHQETLAAHWRQALQQAAIITRSTPSGTLPRGIERELDSIVNPQLDWRSYLWRYLVRTPTDFQGFDRRFVGRGLYLEGLQGESVSAYIAVDTSGSVRDRQLQLFINEVQGILAAYPHLECSLYYIDSDIHESYSLTATSTVPIPQGGGGTSFVPFFERVEEIWDGHTQAVCIYLTDGYGEFPTAAPELPTLWVVPSGGLDLSSFPFGEAVRLVESA